MRETSKTLPLLSDRERSLLRGRGLDIGCGDDPVRPDVQRFDREHGDANCVTRYLRDPESFDYVYSSHCLEHLLDPGATLQDWWTLVKPGGAMFVIVPDEDLYEQGYWPSLFNSDHKSTFTISKQESWSPVSRNLQDLAQSLRDAKIVSLRLQDDKYRRDNLTSRRWPRAAAAFVVGARNVVSRRLPSLRRSLDALSVLLRIPIDQTKGDSVAQALLIVTKTPAERR